MIYESWSQALALEALHRWQRWPTNSTACYYNTRNRTHHKSSRGLEITLTRSWQNGSGIRQVSPTRAPCVATSNVTWLQITPWAVFIAAYCLKAKATLELAEGSRKSGRGIIIAVFNGQIHRQVLTPRKPFYEGFLRFYSCLSELQLRLWF